MKRTQVAVAVTAAMLAVPGVASAATKNVLMGTPPSAGKALQKLPADVNAYFPNTTTIHVGDKVRFVPVGFHTVDLPARGGTQAPFLAPQGSVSGANDAAGQPFWFNGNPALGFNPLLLKSGFGKHLTYTGAARVESGLPLANKPKPMTVKFSKAGTFTFFCNLHPGMKGKVKVVAASKSVPSVSADVKRVKKQVATAKSVANRLLKTTTPSNTIDVGVAGKSGTEYYSFVPAKTTVAVGSTVTFRMSSGTFEEHTATTGPGNPEQSSSYLGKLAASLQSPTFDPALAYPSEKPGTIGSLTPSLHGNGFWNSGVMAGSKGPEGLPHSSQVKFGAAGTYTFYCLIHPFMKETVTVK